MGYLFWLFLRGHSGCYGIIVVTHVELLAVVGGFPVIRKGYGVSRSTRCAEWEVTFEPNPVCDLSSIRYLGLV